MKKRRLSSKEIKEFLVLNPDFFVKNPEVLNSVELVHQSGNAVSLIEKQVELLRTNYNSTTDKLMDLLQVAKNNDDIFALTKKLILSLIEASNIEEIVELVEESFKSEFGVKDSKVLFFSESSLNFPQGRTKELSVADKVLKGLLNKDKSYVGKINEDVTRFIFNKKSTIVEAALVSLSCNSVPGLIALGSDKNGIYDNNKGTLFLDFISEVVSKLIDGHNV